MPVACMKKGQQWKRHRGIKEGGREWVSTDGAEPGTGSRGRRPSSDRRELRTPCNSMSGPWEMESEWPSLGLQGVDRACALEAGLWLPPGGRARWERKEETRGPPSGPGVLPPPPPAPAFSPTVPSANGNAGPVRSGRFDVLMYKCIETGASFHTSSTSLSVSASFSIPSFGVLISPLTDCLIQSL